MPRHAWQDAASCREIPHSQNREGFVKVRAAAGDVAIFAPQRDEDTDINSERNTPCVTP
ncbi:hypothetical protein XCCB100_3662 [Xanthomonas campestris pv. campestris]|uniref:Uncharacterized protein n=1 Tax=Xanthomonas campestris pv. campestris (strain B100) TaxID=509169 RepID=B0RVD6_XANCB|nr:hypothetical protein XCCB100_3662 [Xanthomonas campestris pv. campestris]